MTKACRWYVRASLSSASLIARCFAPALLPLPGCATASTVTNLYVPATQKPQLLSVAAQLKHGQGLTVIGNVIEGSLLKSAKVCPAGWALATSLSRPRRLMFGATAIAVSFAAVPRRTSTAPMSDGRVSNSS